MLRKYKLFFIPLRVNTGLYSAVFFKKCKLSALRPHQSTSVMIPIRGTLRGVKLKKVYTFVKILDFFPHYYDSNITINITVVVVRDSDSNTVVYLFALPLHLSLIHI